MSWEDILKAPPFDALRYERQVSTPRRMTFPSFFSEVLDRYIEYAIRSKRTHNPPKSEKRKYKVSFTSNDVKKYKKYLDKMVGEPTPTGRKYYTGFGARDDYTSEFKDKIKQQMLQEYNMDSIRLIEYEPIITPTFDFEFTLTDSPKEDL